MQWLYNRILFSNISGSLKFKIKVLAGPCFLRVLWVDFFFFCLFQCLIAPGIPPCEAATHRCLHPQSHDSVCVSVTSYGVLACSGSYSKIPQTGWPTKSRNLLLTILEAGSIRSGHQHDQGLVRAFFKLQATNFSLYPHVVEGAREIPPASSTETLIPSMKAFPLLPKSPPNNIVLSVKISTYEFGGNRIPAILN